MPGAPCSNGLRKGRWIGWRLRALVAAALCGCLALLLLVRALGTVPALDEALYGDDSGVLMLGAPSSPRRPAQPRRWQRHCLRAEHAGAASVAALAGRRPSTRATSVAARQARRGPGSRPGATRPRRRPARHGAGATTRQQRPRCDVLARQCARDAALSGDHGGGPGAAQSRNVLYAVMALAQVGNLLFLAAEAIPDWGGRWASCAGPWPAQWFLTLPRRRRWCTSPACIHAVAGAGFAPGCLAC